MTGREQPDFATKTCVTCAHCIVTVRAGMDRAGYVCALANWDAYETRRSGACGREGLNWTVVS